MFKITPSGTVTVVYDFNDATGSGYTPFGGLVLGTDGNFYGTTKAGGRFNQGTLFKITASGTLTPLYNFGTCTYPCKEGLYPKAPPVQGTDGNFYGTTPNLNDGTNTGVVYKVTSAGKFTTIHAFDFTAGYNPNAPLVSGQRWQLLWNHHPGWQDRAPNLRRCFFFPHVRHGVQNHHGR